MENRVVGSDDGEVFIPDVVGAATDEYRLSAGGESHSGVDTVSRDEKDPLYVGKAGTSPTQ
jgi:hypothetical protein